MEHGHAVDIILGISVRRKAGGKVASELFWNRNNPVSGYD